jgi:adenylate cyclase
MLRIQLLGQFKLQVDGEPVRLPSRQAQSLLAYLLLHRGRGHRRELVAGLLWPDLEEDKARSRLRYAIWQSRKAFGEKYLLADKIELSFNTEADYWLDLDAFDRPLLEDLTLQELQDALSIYDGDLLPGFYDDWIVLERDRLQASYGSGMELLLVRLVDAGQWREVVEWAERWISRGHSPEVAYRALMVAYSQLGDSSNALISYKRCQEALEEQLAVEPSAETKRIYELIAAGEVTDGQLTSIVPSDLDAGVVLAQSPPLPPIVHELARDESGVFVARESELEMLERALELALAGSGRVLIVKGDAGRGKTTLLQEFGKRAIRQDKQMMVLWGSGEAQTGQGDPYLPFRDILALLSGDFDTHTSGGGVLRDEARRLWLSVPQTMEVILEAGIDLLESFLNGESLLSRLKPFGGEGVEWFERLKERIESARNRPAPINIQHSDTQKDLFEQYTRVMQRISHQHPLILILDDLQWADSGSINLLFHLGRRIQAHPILIVGSYRPIEVAPGKDGDEHPLIKLLSEFIRIYGEIQIDLDQTDEVRGRHFVDALLDSEPNNFGEAFRDSFHRHTGGHPLFSVELLRQMEDKGEIRKDNKEFWIEGETIEWEALPARVEAVIASRIGRLPSPLLEILRVASVEGEEFTVQVISEVTGLGVSHIINQLSRELDRRHNLVESQGIRLVNEHRLSLYRFRHHLYQMYVYNSMDTVERGHFHEAIGESLEQIYGEQSKDIAVRLARHFEAAALLQKAVDYLLQAGNAAKRLSENEEAIALYTRGLDIVQQLPVSRSQVQREAALSISLGAPLVATKGYSSREAEMTYERARRLYEQIDEPSQLVTALWGLWSFYLVRADYGTARTLAEQISELAQSEPDPTHLLIANWTLGITNVHLAEFTRAREQLEQAIERYDPGRQEQLTYLYGQNPGVTCLLYLAITLWFLGYPDQARDMCHMALDLATDAQHDFSLAFAHSMAATFFAARNEADRAYHHSQNTVELSKKSGFPFLLASGFIIRGWARSEMGKKSMTIRQIRRGLDTMEIMGAGLGRPIFLALLAEIYNKAGQVAEGLSTVQTALEVSRGSGELMYEAETYRLQGDLLDKLGGDSSKVTSNYLKAIDVSRGQEAKLLELRGLISLIRHQSRGALGEGTLDQLAELYGWFGEGFDTGSLQEAKVLLESYS